jgi:hypothetical protein
LKICHLANLIRVFELYDDFFKIFDGRLEVCDGKVDIEKFAQSFLASSPTRSQFIQEEFIEFKDSQC